MLGAGDTAVNSIDERSTPCYQLTLLGSVTLLTYGLPRLFPVPFP